MFMDFIDFRIMFSRIILKWLYIIGAVGITIFGIMSIFSNFLYGIAALIVGNAVWRVMVELWIVMFSIHDSLARIEKVKTVSSTAPADSTES